MDNRQVNSQTRSLIRTKIVKSYAEFGEMDSNKKGNINKTQQKFTDSCNLNNVFSVFDVTCFTQTIKAKS